MPSRSLLSTALLVALAPLCTWGDGETFPGPASPAEQPQWLANITAARAATLAKIAYNGSVYDKYLPWTTSMYIAPQSHIYDRFLFDTTTAAWTPDRFLDDLETRYGGIDGVLLWASYPNMGIDERSQFDLLEDLPGGLAGFGAACARLTERGVRVGLPYNPWDSGTARRNATDATVLAQLGVTLNADFVNGDTMSFMDSSFFWDSVEAGHPLSLQPEGNAVVDSLEWTKMGWGYWPGCAWCGPAPYIPDVDAIKWLERRHLTQVCNRWGTAHATDLQQSFFNGDGFVSWESVWGCWNGLSPRDAEATRRAGALLRFLGPAFTASPDWEPHTPLAAAPAANGLFASRWPAAAGAAYPHAATAWTVVNRGNTSSSAPTVPAPCDGGGSVFFDLYSGARVAPAPVPGGGGAQCAVPLRVEGMGFGALLALAAADAGDGALAAFLARMAAMTATPLAAYNATPTYLQQSMTPVAPAPQAAAPAGTVLVSGAPAWPFAVVGTEIEGRDTPGNDVQFPWEALAGTSHAPHLLPVPALFVDATPVTNAAFAAFLAAAGYAPADSHNFLRDWDGAATPPAGWDAKPVTWVDLLDARAFCAHAGKRLPHDWEWQFAAQGGNPDQAYPWGSNWDASAVPPKATGTVRPAPPDVGSFPAGDTPSGLKDMMGLVWQWTDEFTDDHTRAGLPGSWRRPSCCRYFPNDLTPDGDVRADSHNKLLLMGPSYDRHGAVGFRCVADAPAPPPPPPGATGCADGVCDAFCDSATVRGCAATWAGALSMRSPATGRGCGGALGSCTAPADACAPGWGLCLASNATAGLAPAALRAGLSAAECADSGGAGAYPWRFLGAMSHAQLAWQPGCTAAPTDEDNGCAAGGWGSEPVCCGAGCTKPACANAVYLNGTLVHINQGEGCAAVRPDDADGVLCCKLTTA